MPDTSSHEYKHKDSKNAHILRAVHVYSFKEHDIGTISFINKQILSIYLNLLLFLIS